MARPRFDPDLQQVEKLAQMQCTSSEIAAFLGCSKRTWITHSKRKDVREAIERGRERGKCSLRHAQYQSAMKGNVAMLIWLGKTVLGQSERVTHELAGKEGKPIEITNGNAKQEILSRIAKLAAAGSAEDGSEGGE